MHISFFRIQAVFVIILVANLQSIAQDHGNYFFSNSNNQVTDFVLTQFDTSIVDIEKKVNVDNDYTLDIFLGIGAAPLNSNIGIGYFFTPKIVGYTRFTAAGWMDYFNYSLSIGAKFIQRIGSTMVYSFEYGTLIDGNTHKHNGHMLKGGLGYMFQYTAGFHLGANININLIGESQSKVVWVPELEIVIGVSI